MQTLSCMCLSWGSHKTTFIYPQWGALITLLELYTPCCYSHLSNKQGVLLIFFQILPPSSQKFPPPSSLTSCKIYSLIADFFSDCTIAATWSYLFSPPGLLSLQILHPFSFIPSSSAIRKMRVDF